MSPRYIYTGDPMTDPSLQGQPCDPVRRPDGKCIVGGSKQLVEFAGGRKVVVLRWSRGRARLRRIAE